MNKVSALTVTRIESWLNESRETRMGQAEFRKDLHISYPRFAQIAQSVKVRKASATNREQSIQDIRRVMENTLTGKPVMQKTIERTRQILNAKEGVLVKTTKNPLRMKDAVIQSLFRKAVSGDHNAAFRLAQIMGWIIEKREDKHTFVLNADDHLRIRKEAQRRISELSGISDGTGSVFPEQPLLLEQIRQDTR